jgi:hypothetical protein
MLCPFAVMERLTLGTPLYGVVMLSDATMAHHVKLLDGCKISLFLSELDTAFVGYHHNIEVVLCQPGVAVSQETLMYGIQLLRRKMPVCLLPMSTSLAA